MKLTRHAQARMQQRGISWKDIDYVLDNGRETHDHLGAVFTLWTDVPGKG